MRLDNSISIMVRETLVDNACVSPAVSASVLWSTPGGPHLPPGPLPLPRCGRGRGRGRGEGGLRARVRIPRARTYTDLPRCGRGRGEGGLRARVRIPRARTYTDLPRCGRGRGGGRAARSGSDTTCPHLHRPATLRERTGGGRAERKNAENPLT